MRKGSCLCTERTGRNFAPVNFNSKVWQGFPTSGLRFGVCAAISKHEAKMNGESILSCARTFAADDGIGANVACIHQATDVQTAILANG
jgi:hypothetical protein